MKVVLILMCAMFFSYGLWANDGAYFMSGNQLIPINETSIQIKKEILSLKRVEKYFLEVTVDYTFFNPEKNAKTILVGFEAFGPEGDADFAPLNGQHPYMQNFTVNLNNEVLPYKIDYVSTENKKKSFSLNEISNTDADVGYTDFYYVYHFNATFKPGENKLVHTYKFQLSGSVDYMYNFDYILTAANRWANKQIDDFTLNIDMGNYQDFYINPTFFKSIDEWHINGIGKMLDKYKTEYRNSNGQKASAFFIQAGSIQFKKQNFHPKGELFLFTNNFLTGSEIFDLDWYLPLSTEKIIYFDGVKSENALKVLQNLPYARRGYVFTNKILKEYYENINWYIPNHSYVPEPKELEPEELKWLTEIRSLKIKNN